MELAIVTPAGAPSRPRSVLGLRIQPLVLAAAVVLLLLGGGATLVWPVLFAPTAAGAAGEVFLEAAALPGRDPFTGDVVVGNPPGVKSQAPAGAGGGATPRIAGDTPALYGGSRNEQVCDKEKLLEFLAENPQKAAAWADVLGIQPAAVADYVATLTPVQLRGDTRVTNHGYRNGRATARQAVLQAGTAVLVDPYGRPRVKCGCGNPLADPVAISTTTAFVGDRWPGFSPQNVIVIAEAPRQIDRFVVYDVRSGESFYRVRGTSGEADQPVVIAPDSPPPPPPVVPAPPPEAASCSAGEHREAGGCVPDRPAPCAQGQVRAGGQCVTPPGPVVCPPGTHPVGGGSACEQDVPPPIQCPAGSHPVGEGTACEQDVPPPIQCPAGSHPVSDGTACEQDAPPPIHCPSGSHLVSDGTACAPDRPTTVECPPGSHSIDNGTDCERDKHRPVPCPDGTHEVNNERDCAPNDVPCPPGSHPVSDGTACAKDPEPEPEPDPGSTSPGVG